MQQAKIPPSYWGVASSTSTALFLWLLPISLRLDVRAQFLLNGLAFGAAVHGAVESRRIEQRHRDNALERLISTDVTSEWVELESERRKDVLRQQYGLLPSPPQPVIEAAIVEDWQPVNPFSLSSEAARLMTALEEFQIKAEHTGQIQGARITRHKIKPGRGVSTKKIRALAADLKVALSLPVAPVISEQAGYVAIDIPGKQQMINLVDYIRPETRPNDSPVMMALGVDVLGELVEGNLSDPDYCHGLGGGKTGSGKTELIISLTKSLTDRYSPELVKYQIHTMKAQDFTQPFFQGNPWQWRPTSRNALSALELVKDLVIEMRGRNQFLADNLSKNIDEHNRKMPDAPMAHILFHFDECGGTMLALKQLDRDAADEKKKTAYFPEMNDGLKALAKEARAAGIHLFCWDQKPSEKTLDTDIRSELGLRLCLKVADPEASKMVIGVSDADQLLGKGDMLAGIDGQLTRLQGLYVTSDMLEAVPGYEAVTPESASTPSSPDEREQPADASLSWQDAVKTMKPWISSLGRRPNDAELATKLSQLTGIHQSELTEYSIKHLRKDLGL